MTKAGDFFSLPADQMRKLGYQIIDQIVDHFEHIKEQRVHNIKPFEDFIPTLGGDIPLTGRDPLELVKELSAEVFDNQIKTDHPRFFAFIPGPTNFVSVMADLLTTGNNVFAGHWLAGSAASFIESTTLSWLCKLCGFDEQSGGIFTSGGSAANLMAIATARKIQLGNDDERGCIYYSEQTHNSLSKGLRILGFGEKEMRPVPTNDQLQIDLKALEEQIAKDIENGYRPFCLVGNAGTTNTGAIDPLNALADIAFKYQMWLHVDGAYGAAAVVTERGKAALAGLERVNSLTLDPHKWWFQPFEIGCLLIRKDQDLKTMFGTTASYLKDTQSTVMEEKNFYDRGLQLTRSFKAFKFYLSIKTFGLETFQQAIDKGIDMALEVERILTSRPNWRIITPAQMGIITFQYAPEGLSEEEINALCLNISQELTRGGYAMVLTTRLFDKTVLRMCPIHPNVTVEELEETVKQLELLASSF